eukprot:COSAG02_NODE_9682_length_2142_cov_1.923152_3_plen_63_part_00
MHLHRVGGATWGSIVGGEQHYRTPMCDPGTLLCLAAVAPILLDVDRLSQIVGCFAVSTCVVR